MSYTAPRPLRHWFSIDTLLSGPFPPQNSVSSAVAWPSADLAIYVPVVVAERVVVTKLWYANGSTATGNYDIGLYDAAGTQLLGRGSTAKTTTSDEIVWDCTDTTIGPGIYYLALACSNNTDTFIASNPAAPSCTALGLLTEASALPLPATATFALLQTLAVYPVIGMTISSSILA